MILDNFLALGLILREWRMRVFLSLTNTDNYLRINTIVNNKH